MGHFNLRSLLLAAIFISSSITLTASRHHYTHNVHGHRSRHRRQGAGLFLSSSYVIPGGEGSGAWGEWGEISPCSRTCGGGVASQKRICLEVGPDGQPRCTGGDTKYFSCETHDCPDGSSDFRAQQCSEFDEKSFQGIRYTWVPYTKGPNPCELNCMPRGERFYYRQKSKVIDGTRCSEESFDVCVNGTCQPVGCDMMLGSSAREDKCRECRGNGANCHTVSDRIDTQDLRSGYNDVLLIPQGATSISIAEIRPSSNYLAIRANNGTYYLNGEYHIDFPRSIDIAGTTWHYERSQDGLPSPDKLRCQGPTYEPLFLSLLLQEPNVGIDYEYSLPKELAPPPNAQYSWVHDEYTPCSASCGGGIQFRNVSCRSREDLELVEEVLCESMIKPASNQSCSTNACPARWVEGEWGPCSRHCGEGGSRSRHVHCEKIIAQQFRSVVADKECFELLGKKPPLFEECNQNASCPVWYTGPWKPCDKLRGEGKQTRQVQCYQKTDGKIQLLDDKDCPDEKPPQDKPCMIHPADGVDWVLTDWAGCDSCLSTYRTKSAVCATKSNEVVADSQCGYHPAPLLRERCDPALLPACPAQWYATQWSNCSADCGKGVQTRRVFCGIFNGASVITVDETRCDPADKYNDSKSCEVPKDKCPSKWFAGPWTECTTKCGGGEQFRRVMCFRGDQPVKDCPLEGVLDSTQACNTGPCNKDQILPVNPNSTPIMDDYDYEECEDYPEEGAEVDDSLAVSLIDEMFSDTPYTAETESEFTETGSGFGTTDGSGFGTSDITISTEEGTTETGSISTDETGETGSGFSTGETEKTIEESESTDLSSIQSVGSTVSTDLSPTTSLNNVTSLTEETKLTDETEETSFTESTFTGGSSESEPTTEADIPDDIVSTTTPKPTSESIKSTLTGESSESEPTTEADIDLTTEVTSETGSPSSDGSESTEETDISDDIVSTTTPNPTSKSIESTLTGESSESEPTTEADKDLTTEVTSETGSTSSDGSESTEETDISDDIVSTTTPNPTSKSIKSTLTGESSESEPTTEADKDLTTEVTSETGSTSSDESESTEETDIPDDKVLNTTPKPTKFTTTDGTSETLEYDYTEESTVTDESTINTSDLTDETAETSSTETSSTESDDATNKSTTESASAESTLYTKSELTELTGVTETETETSTEFSESTGTSESGSTEELVLTTEKSTEETESSELSTTESSETVTEQTGSTEVAETGSIETEETGSTEIAETGSTETQETESTEVEVTGSTEAEETGSTETTETGSTVTKETESTETTETESTVTEENESLTTETGSTVIVETGSTETTESGSTEATDETAITEESTVSGETTSWDWSTTICLDCKRPKCPPRNAKCKKSTFGCCPDEKTAAAGPFDEGCPKADTCADTEFGCCPDGVSPATRSGKGCPVLPCNETLFGCCKSDNKTPAEGNDQEGCPPPPPACLSSEYGCCKDKKAEATGPNKEGCPETESKKEEGQKGCAASKFGCCYDNTTAASGPDPAGCPCNTTEFGCCPDGVSPAGGTEMEGCVMSCNSSAFGCCPDGETPAHGYDLEGCCLLYAFGCCPDNYKPAEGPHLEGCGCQHTHHGCCPDNVTIARGANNEGCGCLYTEHGCCPDRHTQASGPKFEGCDCSTYQFGCCDDGVTPSIGPGGQGCHCQQSEFGCCGDEKTAATGPDQAGCDCSNSKYGCCPDGQTSATGKKFLGCTDKPENRQAACSLSTDRGSCTNYTVHWYYDMEYGGCSRFWYGGCEGNGNRFTSKEECEDVCVQPAPKDACNLPRVKGACVGYNPRWYYDAEREHCAQFVFGGCLGNANNFDSQDLCQKQCEPARSVDQCTLPIERGSCAGNYPRWGFNSESRGCEQFVWGGCEGNDNRFRTETACLHRCNPPGSPQPVCKEPQDAGNCTEKQPAWSFSQTENRCMPFYFSGCGGNGNRFLDERLCAEACPSSYVKPMCTLPALTGECADYTEKWYYDTAIKRCRQFYYGGCGGNENRFSTQQECESHCSEVAVTARPPPGNQLAPENVCTLPSMTGECADYTQKWFYDSSISRCRQFYYGGCGGNNNRFESEQECQARCIAPARPRTPPPPSGQEVCFLSVDGGPCDDRQTRWAYDAARGECAAFAFGGCGGNQNNFPTREHCQRVCDSIQDVCQLPMLSGPCEDSLMRWFYDPASDSCSQFTYGGCDGNGNRFESAEDCERRCRSGPAPAPARNDTAPLAPQPQDEELPPACRVSAAADEECAQEETVWYWESTRQECASHDNAAAGSTCRRHGVFPSEEACERTCGAFRNIDVCRQPQDPGPCKASIPKFYYDSASGNCLEFSYGGCHGGANRFSYIQECEDICKFEKDPCKRRPKPLSCVDYDITWFFDEQRDNCYSYGSCDHTDNTRLVSREQCEGQCRRRPPASTSPRAPPLTPAPQPAEEACQTPASLRPCGSNVTVFYYDAAHRACLPAGIGACGHPNSYRSEEECLRQCDVFRGLDPCRYPLDVGVGGESIPKYYWKLSSGRCESYAYSGSGGGPNRFSSVEECMQVCGHTGPEAACLEAVSVGAACGAGGVRWYYSEPAAACLAFVYRGCGGSANNFASREDCVARCRVHYFDMPQAPEVNSATEPEVSAQEGGKATLRCLFHGNPPPKITWQRGEIIIDSDVDRYRILSDGALEIVSLYRNDSGVYICIAENIYGESRQEITLVVDDAGGNEVLPNCDRYNEECDSLQCASVRRAATEGGCERCWCEEPADRCAAARRECQQIQCPYSVSMTVDQDGCDRCMCTEHPCQGRSCAPGERCELSSYLNPVTQAIDNSTECRLVNKPGLCPTSDLGSETGTSCRRECNDDANCRGVGKCCVRGCSMLCVEPATATTPAATPATPAPELPQAPQANSATEPEVTAREGGKATLRCLFHGNPPPRITWRHGEITIDGDVDRYRVLSDGALEIVSLYRNDSGVYICIAENIHGVSRQEIHLQVNDPQDMAASIAGEPGATVTGEFGRSLNIRCMAYGYPSPSIYWYRGKTMLPYSSELYEARENRLQIRKLDRLTLGEYSCQAYNGIGKAALWTVTVQAYRDEDLNEPYLVPREPVRITPGAPRPSRTTTPAPEIDVPVYTAEVNTSMPSGPLSLTVGGVLNLPCDVEGYPLPEVYWTKDGARLSQDSRTRISEARLTMTGLTSADSGEYGCHAQNAYSAHSSTVQITVQEILIPVHCEDNPFFANCQLIVRSKFCNHPYYSSFCCKSCVEAGQLNPEEVPQADASWKKKK